MFLQCGKEPLFVRIKFHHNRMLIKVPYLSCEVKTWIIISYGKPEMQKLKLTMSIVLGEKLNSWQSPNVLLRLHNYSKLIHGHTYKLVSKYLKLTVYLIAEIITWSSCQTSKPFSATVKGKLFNFCFCDTPRQLTILLWWWQLVPNIEVNRIIY